MAAGRGVPPKMSSRPWQPLLDQPPLAELRGDPLVDAALRELHCLLPPSVAVHSLRVFLLADARARARGIGYDQAGLLAAAVFHDTGLTGNAPVARGGFPSRSAELLDRFLRGRGVDAGRREVLTRAVRAHMRTSPAPGAGPEERLLHFGAWLDVTGRGSSQVPGERRRLASLAATPWFAFSFSARLAADGVRRALPASSPAR